MIMTTPEMMTAIEDKMVEIAFLLESYYKKPMPIPQVVLKSRMGLKGGHASRVHNRIELNLDLCHIPEYWHHLLTQTLPHEYCHLVAPLIYQPWVHGKDRHNGWSHGRAWQECMRVIGRPPERCIDMNEQATAACRVRTRTVKRQFVYTCPCGKHFHLTAIKHNRILQGRGRYCKACKGTLTFKGYAKA